MQNLFSYFLNDLGSHSRVSKGSFSFQRSENIADVGRSTCWVSPISHSISGFDNFGFILFEKYIRFHISTHYGELHWGVTFFEITFIFLRLLQIRHLGIRCLHISEKSLSGSFLWWLISFDVLTMEFHLVALKYLKNLTTFAADGCVGVSDKILKKLEVFYSKFSLQTMTESSPVSSISSCNRIIITSKCNSFASVNSLRKETAEKERFHEYFGLFLVFDSFISDLESFSFGGVFIDKETCEMFAKSFTNLMVDFFFFFYKYP